MAQVIAPEVWQDGIDDNQLLPNRYTVGLFTGRGINLANDGRACRVYDILTTDYITDYDDRRLNGLGYGTVTASSPFPGFNADGRDGWGASAYGVFQDVKFTSKVYTMGRHRSVAMRLFDEMQYDASAFTDPSSQTDPKAKYADGIGKWGDAGQSFAVGNGQALMKTAALMSKAKDRWQKQVLGPDIDKYTLFAIMNGHQTGRCVAVDAHPEYNDMVFTGDAEHYQWVAQPGPVQGQPIAPSFAPIHCVEWDNEHIPQMLQNIKVTWNNLFIDQSDRVVLIDPFYEYDLLSALTGSGVPATDSAYTDLQNGSFTRLMGWDFNFEIPSNYWPKLYVDANLNVVHSSTGTEAFDKIINSIPDDQTRSGLLKQLIASDRMSRTNWIRTDWDSTNGFTKTLTNYPMGSPAWDGYYGASAVKIVDGQAHGIANAEFNAGAYPWEGQGVGYGLKPHSDSDAKSASGPQGNIRKVNVIGCFLWKKAAQMSQEYSEMVTDEGRTRGKFQEMCMDVKYDAWVIENYSHGIIPIIDDDQPDVTFTIPVSVSGSVATVETPASLLGVTVSKGSTALELTLSYDIEPASAPSITYQWKKDGTDISGATTSTLKKAAQSNTTPATPGQNNNTALVADHTYSCTVTVSGSATGTATGSLVYTA